MLGPAMAAPRRYNLRMDALDMAYVRNSAAGWALWKVLDRLLLRYFPGWWPESHNGHGARAGGFSAPAAAQLKQLLASPSFAAACRELQDDASPVVQALARVWTVSQQPDSPARIEHALAGLSAEQIVVVLAVLATAQ
jgi:hypothetical protein